MAAELSDAVAKPEGVHTLAEELVLQMSANSLQEKTVREVESLPLEQRKELFTILFKHRVTWIYNISVNSMLGPVRDYQIQ